jgi:hypothetical protein
MNQEAEKEIADLMIEQKTIVENKDRLRNTQSTQPHEAYKMYDNMIRQQTTKYYKVEDKINEIKKLGISSKQKTRLKKELVLFALVESDKSIGSTDVIKVGYSKTLGDWVKVSYTKFSSFMSNVRGCGSLANTIDIRSLEMISASEASTLVNAGKKFSVSFAGSTQVTTIDGAGNRVVKVNGYTREV